MSKNQLVSSKMYHVNYYIIGAPRAFNRSCSESLVATTSNTCRLGDREIEEFLGGTS
jgi:hypothetical protein